MTNYDMYADFIKDEMLERGNCQFGVTKNNEPKLCRQMECNDCVFHGVDMTCTDFRRHWLAKEAKLPITVQLKNAIEQCKIECGDQACRTCPYEHEDACLTARMVDKLVNTFNITNKED